MAKEEGRKIGRTSAMPGARPISTLPNPDSVFFNEVGEGKFVAPSKIYWLDGAIDDVQEYRIEHYENVEGLMDRVLTPPTPVRQLLELTYSSKHFHSFAAAREEANDLEHRALDALIRRENDAIRRRKIELDRIHDQAFTIIQRATDVEYLTQGWLDKLQGFARRRERLMKGEVDEGSKTAGGTDRAHDDRQVSDR